MTRQQPINFFFPSQNDATTPPSIQIVMTPRSGYIIEVREGEVNPMPSSCKLFPNPNSKKMKLILNLITFQLFNMGLILDCLANDSR